MFHSNLILFSTSAYVNPRPEGFSLPVHPIRSHQPIPQFDNAPRELCRVGRAFRGDLGRRTSGEGAQPPEERGRHAVWEHAALPRMMRTMILEPAWGTGPTVASSCAGSTPLERSGTARLLVPDRQTGLHRPAEAGLQALDSHGRDDAEQAENPQDEPAYDRDGDRCDHSSFEAFGLKSWEERGKPENQGRDDE